MSDIEARFDIDGPHTPDLAGQAAADIAHLVRYLNHATLPHRAAEALPNPQDVGRLLGDLETALDRLPQLLGQIGQRLDDMRGPALRADGDVDPAGEVHDAVSALGNGWDYATHLAAAVGRAREAADRLYVDEGER